MIEIGAGEVVTYHDVINVTCTEKHHGKTSAVSQCQQMLTSDNKFAGWVVQTAIEETVNVTCRPTSHCDFSTDGPPIPVEGVDDIEFRPYLDFLGQPQMMVAPVEVGGKITAQCRQSDLVLDPAVRLLHTGDPILSLIAEVRPVLLTSIPSLYCSVSLGRRMKLSRGFSLAGSGDQWEETLQQICCPGTPPSLTVVTSTLSIIDHIAANSYMLYIYCRTNILPRNSGLIFYFSKNVPTVNGKMVRNPIGVS